MTQPVHSPAASSPNLIREGLVALWIPGLAVSGLGVMAGLALGLEESQRTALAIGLIAAGAVAVPGAILTRVALHPGSSLNITVVSGAQLLLKAMVLVLLFFGGSQYGWKFPQLVILAGAFAGAAMLMQFGVQASLLRQAAQRRSAANDPTPSTPLGNPAPAPDRG